MYVMMCHEEWGEETKHVLCTFSVDVCVYGNFNTPRRQALLCLLAKNCSEAGYIRLVEALCNEHQIKLLKV